MPNEILILRGHRTQRARDRSPVEHSRSLARARGRIEVGSLGQNLATLAMDARAAVSSSPARCPAGIRSLDLSNEFSATDDILQLDSDAVAKKTDARHRRWVRRMATESVVLRLCAGRPRPSLVRDDAIASVALENSAGGKYSAEGHAGVEWASGKVAEGWLRAGDDADFTADVMADVTLRLLKREGRAGAFTPGALFGPELAESVGGTFIPVSREEKFERDRRLPGRRSRVGLRPRDGEGPQPPVRGNVPALHGRVRDAGVTDSTAASALFQQNQLWLQRPLSAPVATGEAVVVFGGSTSVGMNAIPLTTAAGSSRARRLAGVRPLEDSRWSGHRRCSPEQAEC
jgi:hypothetical protein